MHRDLSSSELEQLIAHPPDMEHSLGWFLERRAPTAALIKLLRESPDPEVRYVVCYVLDRTHPRSAREALLETLFDPVDSVRQAAADAYAKVGRATDGPIVMAAYRLETSRTTQGYLVIALGAIRYQKAAHMLIGLLDSNLRVDAAWSLGQLDGPEVTAALRKQLEHESDSGMINRLKTGLRLIEERANSPVDEGRRRRNAVKVSY